MLRAFAGAFAINSLRARSHDFFDRQLFLPDYFEHLCGAERVHVHKFCHLGHVTAVRSLVKDDVDLIQRSRNRIAIA